MRRQNHVRMAILVIGALAMLAVMAQDVLARSPLPAATAPSPEEAQLKQLPAPAQQIGRPSKAELLARCQQRLACRTTLEVAQKTWPLAAQPAVSVYLTPQNRSVSSPYSRLNLYGVNYQGSYVLSINNSTSTASAENKPYVYAQFNAPVSGWYILDVRTSHVAAKLRHQSGGPIIETWDAGSVPCAAYVCDYATMEYLQQGVHNFYFYSTTHGYNFYSVSIESYP